MAVTLSELKVYVASDESDNDDLLTECLVDAAVLVNKYVGVAAVPVEILDRCHIIVAADLWERRNAPNGIANQQYATIDGIGAAPVRIARDPMAGAYKLLQRWVLPF